MPRSPVNGAQGTPAECAVVTRPQGGARAAATVPATMTALVGTSRKAHAVRRRRTTMTALRRFAQYVKKGSGAAHAGSGGGAVPGPAPVLQSIKIEPENPEFPVGSPQQLRAYGTF